MKVIDAHIHFPLRDGLKTLIETCEKNGIEQCFLCALPRTGLNNAAVKEAIDEYSDLLKGFAYLNLENDTAETVEKLYSDGFSGIKLIAPPRPYDWEGYFPLYEKIEEKRMPVLFHTGIVARGVRKTSEKGVTSSNMRPIYLETIARRFQDLTLIGAHLGHPWCEEAAVVSFHNPNVYFDISGGHTFYIAQTLWRRLNYDIKTSKILFGSDSTPKNMKRYIHFWQTVLPQLGLTEKDLKAIFYENAAKIISKGS